MFCVSLTAHILPKVTCDLRLKKATSVWTLPHICNLKLANPSFDQPDKTDLLIGSDYLGKLILSKPLQGADSDVVAIDTVFGWAIMGPYSTQYCTWSAAPSNNSIINAISEHVTASDSDDLLKRFWEMEQVWSVLSHTPEEKVVVDHYATNHVILPHSWY